MDCASSVSINSPHARKVEEQFRRTQLNNSEWTVACGSAGNNHQTRRENCRSVRTAGPQEHPQSRSFLISENNDNQQLLGANPTRWPFADDGNATVTGAGEREADGASRVHGDEVVLGREPHLHTAGEVHRHGRHLHSPAAHGVARIEEARGAAAGGDLAEACCRSAEGVAEAVAEPGFYSWVFHV